MPLKPSQTPLAGRGRLDSGLHDTRLVPTDRAPARPGAAPASISAADISACLPLSVGRGSLVTEDPREVSPLSRRGDVVRGRTHPLSDPLQVGLRFLPHPSSAAPSAILAESLPLRGGNGVTSFTSSINPGVRSCFSAGGAPSATGEYRAPGPDHVPFGSSLTAS